MGFDSLLMQYRSSSREYVARLELENSPELAAFTGEYVDVAESVLRSDRYFRRVERHRVLRLDEAPDAGLAADALRWNNAALDGLEQRLPTGLSALRERWATIEFRGVDPLAESFRATVVRQIADSDMSVYEAREAVGLCDRALSAGRAGPGPLHDLVASDLMSLAERRRSRPEHNDPAAAIVGGIFALIGTAKMIECSSSGTCGQPGNILSAITLFGMAALCFSLAVGPVFW